ncbi:tryptophan halogenase family protein [Sphingomonas sp. CD22]|uniref:tryptophan halogenase family protein n=1 Tax=Sphingomonas sp. CD22 TaxID=3100214 RepID=UPI002ADEFEF3|nr:tryptophan halogenase family protein [Sphingomonas sp. CD22]MEA1084499.1 tryptophan halogenase family protein [Sphingomonas sp. CD22]
MTGTTGIRRIVIAGGGTAGWLAAAILTRQLGALAEVTLVESEDIGTVGVGESTIPTVRAFHALIGIDEQEFMRATGASFKLAISFENWARDGDRYIHSFGDVGKSTWMSEFHHFWLEAQSKGLAQPFGAYCLEHEAAIAGRFAVGASPALNYAYHFDAGRYARYLRDKCETNGLRRIEGKIERVEQDAHTGDIAALVMADGRRVEGDLFFDCTGFRALLIGETLGVGFEDWSHWLPTNRALAIQTRATGPAVPYTRAIAHDAGWRWKIPLQHRVGNGLVYCADYLSDEAAQARLLDAVEGEHLITPRLIKFRTGRRRAAWHRNCIALSLASGFVEPLESTSIHLIMIALTRFLQLLPAGRPSDATVARFNEQAAREIEGVRDFIILHYHLNERDEPFWRDRREMRIPDSLAERIALFRDSANAYQDNHELFRVASWLQVMLGQRLGAASHHPLVQLMPPAQLKATLSNMADGIAGAVRQLPPHQTFLDRYCGIPAEART